MLNSVFYVELPRAAMMQQLETLPPAVSALGLLQARGVSNSTVCLPARAEAGQQKTVKSFFARLKAVFCGRGNHPQQPAGTSGARLSLTPQGPVAGAHNPFGSITFTNLTAPELPGSGEVTLPSSRTTRAALVDMAALIEARTDLSTLAKCDMGGKLRNLFLTGRASKSSLNNLHTAWAAKYANTSSDFLPSIQALIDSADMPLAPDKQYAQHYCQLFERELAGALLTRPSSGMLQVSQYIKDYILADMVRYDDAGQTFISLAIREHMASDTAAYLKSIPDVAQFMERPSPLGLIHMLDTDSVHALPLVWATVLRYTLCAPHCAKIVNDAQQFYSDVILTSRSLNAASEHGKGSELGTLGCNNLLNFLFSDIQEQFPAFSMDRATLITAAFFSLSSGQAFNESFAVFAHHSKQHFQPLSYKTLSYNSDAAPAVNHAYQELLKVATEINQFH